MPTHKATSRPLSAIVLVVVANVLIPLAIGLFGKGFFPYKPLLPGLARYEDHGDGPPPPAPFDRVIFMVVDALRSDFVYTANSGFEFTQSLIRSGAAIPFTAHATSPTVTMPRIKAITTGSTPSFLDVVLNVDEGDQSSSLASQDTWLAQLKAKAAGDLLLFGDDTWLKLFPDTFDRADGTSSFFVADFTEVDRNVTRHVAAELRRPDWSLMVLHYLGLDHIGHKGGPRSPNMLPKQREMDAVVRQIYAALAAEPHLARTLLVLAGDHGMNDAGNHGASSAGETSPALVFAAPLLAADPLLLQQRARAARAAPLADRPDFQFYSAVDQADLAPTLAALLGFPVPKNNLGAFIPAFLPLWPDRRHQTQTLLRNARQILGVLTAAFGADAFALPDGDTAAAAATEGRCAAPRSDVDELACAWHAIVRTIPDAGADHAVHDAWVERTVQWLRSAQQIMSGMASNYDMPLLGLGIGLAAAALALAVYASATVLRATAARRGDAGVEWRALVPFAGINIAYGVMMFASSYVEEEQHFWYWASASWLALTSLRRLSALSSSPEAPTVGLFSSTAALVALRLIRAWNQTGQKFAGGPDLVKAFLVTNPALLWTLVAATYLWCGARLVRGLLDSLDVVADAPSDDSPNAAITFSIVAATAATRIAELTVRVAVPILVFAAFLFKLVFALEDSPELVGSFVGPLVDLDIGAIAGMTLVTHARVVFAGLALVTAVLVYALLTDRPLSSKRTALHALLPVYTLFGATQSRTTNIPLFLLFDVVRHQLHVLLTTAPRPGSGTGSGAPPPRRLWAGAGPDLAAATLLLQHTAFFAFGGTNAISSVDLSSAYNGISGFSAAAVGVLLFASNWAGALYWALAAVLLLVDGALPAETAAAEAAPAPQTGPADASTDPAPALTEKEKDSTPAGAGASPFLLYVTLLSVFAAASTVAVMAACTALRTHLFVWTVFSPKYLYCAAWSLGMHLAVHVGLGGLLYRLGTWSTRSTSKE